MPRNGNGVFTVLNPVQIGQLRSSSEVNANYVDAGSEITNSLPIDAQAGMTGQFLALEGDVTSPGISFTVDTNSGFRRSANNELRWVGGGNDRAIMDENGKLTLLNGLQVTGSVNLSSVLRPQNLFAVGSAVATLRRKENDTAEHELVSYESGSGVNAKGSLRVVGSATNNVSTLRYYVNNVKAFEWTANLFSVGVNMGVGQLPVDTTDLIFNVIGNIDVPDRVTATTVGTPSSNIARIYARTSSGASHLFYKDSLNSEIELKTQPVNRQVFTTSGTWTKPTTGIFALVETWGGGASGGRGPDGAGGGGGGSHNRRIIALASLSASISVTVGAGGDAVASANGNPGGNSSFGIHVQSFGGGAGGDNSTTATAGGGGGGGLLSVGEDATRNTEGGDGGSPQAKHGTVTWGSTDSGAGEHVNSNPFGGGAGGGISVFGSGGETGQTAIFGGGGGGVAPSGGASNDGGASIYGGGGGARNAAGNGGASQYGGAGGGPAASGTAPGGGGGGGGSTDALSGAGARGEVRVTVW